MGKIDDFLKRKAGHGDGSGSGGGYDDGDGYGYGGGDGSGWGDGDGSGWGDGDGSGDGYGGGNGYGDGYGDGDGIKSINGMLMHKIDGIPTIITKIHNNIAKGYILNSDLTLSACYVIKRDGYFAHGETLKKAQEALQEKLFDVMGEEERINMFLEEFDINIKHPAMKYFEWHHKLTGSCEMGRMTFAKNHGIDLNNDEYTVEEFVELCENDYGGEIIKEVKKAVIQERRRITDADNANSKRF